MQGHLVGQSEMTLTGPVIDEKVGIVCGWMWAGMMEMKSQCMGVARAVGRK